MHSPSKLLHVVPCICIQILHIRQLHACCPFYTMKALEELQADIAQHAATLSTDPVSCYQAVHMQNGHANIPMQTYLCRHAGLHRQIYAETQYAHTSMQTYLCRYAQACTNRYAQACTNRHAQVYAQIHALLHADRAGAIVHYDSVYIPAWLQEDQELKEAAAAKKWLMSEQTLDKRVVQQLDFTKSLRAQRHLFLEVRKLSVLFVRTPAGVSLCAHLLNHPCSLTELQGCCCHGFSSTLPLWERTCVLCIGLALTLCFADFIETLGCSLKNTYTASHLHSVLPAHQCLSADSDVCSQALQLRCHSCS